MKYATLSDDKWANLEIERWQMQTAGVNPLRQYVLNVVTGIINRIPKETLKYSGVDDYIVEDIITQEPDDFMDKNIYDFYEEHIDESIAIVFFNNVIEEYMLG